MCIFDGSLVMYISKYMNDYFKIDGSTFKTSVLTLDCILGHFENSRQSLYWETLNRLFLLT